MARGLQACWGCVGGVALITTLLRLWWHFHSCSSHGGLFISRKWFYIVMHYSQCRCRSDLRRLQLTGRQTPSQSPLPAGRLCGVEIDGQTDARGLWAFLYSCCCLPSVYPSRDTHLKHIQKYLSAEALSIEGLISLKDCVLSAAFNANDGDVGSNVLDEHPMFTLWWLHLPYCSAYKLLLFLN